MDFLSYYFSLSLCRDKENCCITLSLTRCIGQGPFRWNTKDEMMSVNCRLSACRWQLSFAVRATCCMSNLECRRQRVYTSAQGIVQKKKKTETKHTKFPYMRTCVFVCVWVCKWPGQRPHWVHVCMCVCVCFVLFFHIDIKFNYIKYKNNATPHTIILSNISKIQYL